MTTRLHHHPTGLGDVVLRSHHGDDGAVESVEIVQADPRVLISGHLLRELRHGDGDPRVPLATVDHVGVGGVMRIHGCNRQLVYRLTEFEPLYHGCRVYDTYVGEWPD